MNNWAAAEILLAAAVLALAMPREDGFVIPERRDWVGWVKGLLPRMRRQREDAAGREAEQYLADLHTDRGQSPMLIRQSQLPSAVRRFDQVRTQPTPDQKPPWPTAENRTWTIPLPPETPREEPQQQQHRRRAPGDPPTIVMEVMRPAVAGDLGRYLEGLPSYEKLPSRPDFDSADAVFVPRSTVGLGTPDHEGAPGDNHEARPEAEDLQPGQPGAVDPPVEG